MERFVIAGAFGQGNPGDEALLEAFVRALPGTVIATSSTPDETAERHGCSAVSARPNDVRRAVASADAFVVGGGTVFKELHPRSGRRPAALLETAAAALVGARALRKPTALVGVGAAPILSNRGKALARLLVRAADVTILRDEESAHVLGAAGAPAPFRVGADAAWTVLETQAQALAPPDGRIVVVPSVFAAADGDAALVQHLVAALGPVVGAGLPVAILPWQRGDGIDEAAIAEVVARRIGADVLPVPSDLHDAQRAMRGASLVVGMRFHALVAAGAAGVRFLAIGHEPKLDALARRLEQPCVPASVQPDELAAVIMDAAGYGSCPSPAAVQLEVRRAEEMLKLLRLALADAEQVDPTTFVDLPLVPPVIAR